MVRRDSHYTLLVSQFHLSAEIGVGAKPASDSNVLFDGSRFIG